MNWLDYAILAIIGLSALISLVRGFVKEVLSLIIWIAAVWIGLEFSRGLSVYLEPYITSPSLRIGAAFVALFVLTLVIGGIINYLAGQLVGRTGLTGTDRLVGVLFGVGRGLVVVAVVVLAAGLTAIPREQWWRDSVMVHQIQPWVCRIGVADWLGDLVLYAPVSTEKVAVARGTPAPEYWKDYCRSGTRVG